MADIRIKDLATTASVTASDDFMAVDGVTNGTRKLSAATPSFATSVTTPSLTSPASTPLTLGTTDSGAAITVLSASNNVGIGTTSPTQKLEVYNSSGNSYLALDALNASEAGLVFKNAGVAKWYINRVGSSNDLNFYNSTGAGASQMYFKSDGNVGIGTTTPGAFKLNVNGDAVFGAAATRLTTYSDSTYSGIFNGVSLGSAESIYMGLGALFFIGGGTERMRIASTGDVSIASTTAGASNAGALVVQGGISAGNTGAASYFGGAATFAGAVTIGNTVNTVSPTSPNRTITMVVGGVTLYIAAKTTND